MKRITTALSALLILTGCASQPEWSPAVGGLSCRVHTLDDSPLLTVAIRNQSDAPVSLPTWNDGVPRLTIKIREEPEVLSPPSFGGAMPTKRVVPPGETYTFPLIGAYLLFYGTPTDDGWTPFVPTDETYHILATVHTDTGDLVAPPLPMKLKERDAEQAESTVPVKAAPGASSPVR